jgi:hypothetical protein
MYPVHVSPKRPSLWVCSVKQKLSFKRSVYVSKRSSHRSDSEEILILSTVYHDQNKHVFNQHHTSSSDEAWVTARAPVAAPGAAYGPVR